MTFESSIYLIVFLLCLLTLIQGGWSLLGGVRFYRYVSKMVAGADGLMTESGAFRFQPKVALIMPCCGVDEKLQQTVGAVARQHFVDYEVIFTFESAEDPAYAVVGGWTEGWTRPPRRLVVAGLSERRSQKIHNLLAAVEAVSADREVLVFLDSDAVPPEDWLGHLVAPLQDESVGASTGYRWYGAAGGIAAGVRSAWNAATVTLLDDEKLSFCWGGATAIRREAFASLGVGRYWDRALSDDLQMTRAVRDAGLAIRFVPQALVSSSDRTTFGGFLSFARRQVLITRVCAPAVWWAGFLLTCNFMAGGTAAAALLVVSALGWFGDRWVMLAALLGWLLILGLAAGKSALRQLAIRKVVPAPAWTWRDFWWDVVGTVVFSGMLHMGLFAASLTTRRIVWRNTEYELVSAAETRLLRRRDGGA